MKILQTKKSGGSKSTMQAAGDIHSAKKETGMVLAAVSGSVFEASEDALKNTSDVLSSMRHLLDKMTAKITGLQKENVDLRTRLSTLSEQQAITDLRKENDDLFVELDNALFEQEAITEENKKLRLQLKAELSKQEKINELKRVNEDLRTQLDTALLKQEAYEEGQKLLCESFEKYRTASSVENSKIMNAAVTMTPRRRGMKNVREVAGVGTPRKSRRMFN